ncbi:hypothetical protein OAH36_03525 [Verrucomicrobia bacterium]|jgi:putative transposase|nr:hypothetical protein [Verrucomicrobiota bacterium]
MVDFLTRLSGLILAVAGLFRYGVRFLVAMCLNRADASARIIALESQLDASMRQNSPKRVYRLSHSFRFLWIILVLFWSSWETACHAMKPRTVVGWWRQGFRRYWRSISQGKPGRKGLSIELRKLIRRMSLENPLWGGAKIRDVLVELGYQRLDVGTIRKYMEKRSKDPSGTWKAFLRNHMNVAWGMDFCVVRSVGFKALYVFVIIEHGRRKIRRIAVTETPSAA